MNVNGISGLTEKKHQKKKNDSITIPYYITETTIGTITHVPLVENLFRCSYCLVHLQE